MPRWLVTSIVQGGPAPHCFSAAIADYIVYGEVRSPVNLNDIADIDVREKMEKVHLVYCYAHHWLLCLYI